MSKFKILLTICVSAILMLTLINCSFAAVTGDVDSDGKISAADARLALRASVGLENYADGSEQFIAADVDFDSKISAADARLILRASVGLEALAEPAHTHTFGEWKQEKNGNIITGNHIRTCSECGEKETAACTYGSWVQMSPASCTSNQLLARTCSVCSGRQNKAGKAALGHNKTELIAEKSSPATCVKDGNTVYYCSRCKKNYAEFSKAFGHSFTNYISDKNATCLADGTKTAVCDREGCTATDTVTDTGSKLTHKFEGAAKSNNNGTHSFACLNNCGQYGLSEKCSYESKVSKAATCTEKGTTQFTCKKCSYSYTKNDISALGHDYSVQDTSDAYFKSEATCSKPKLYYYKCSRCTAKGTKTFGVGEALGHIYDNNKRVLTVDKSKCVLPTEFDGCFYCSRCGKNTVEAFNKLVNAIKSDEFMNDFDLNTNNWKHSVTYFSKTTLRSTCNTFDIDPIIYQPTIKDLYDEEMNSDDITYAPVREKKHLYNMPVISDSLGKNTVSFLEDGDADVEAQIISGLNMSNVLSGIDNTFTVGSASYNVSSYKKNIGGSILKVTVKPHKEEFFGTNGVSKLPVDEMTLLEKISGYDIRKDAAEFGSNYTLTQKDSEANIYDIGMTMKLKGITSGAAVTFYFAADTLSPIAAVYDIDVVMSQDVLIDIKLFGLNLLHVTGKMDPVVSTNLKQFYLFSDYFG